MRYLSLLLFLCLGLTSCGGGDASADAEMAAMEASRVAQQSAYDAMMAGHDRVMPLMGRITASQKAIMTEMKTEGLADDRKDLLEAANEQLQDAYDGMMDWMGGLKPLDELRANMDNDAIITYIKQEAGDIAKIEMSTATALGTAKELMGDHAGHSHDGHDHDGHSH